MIGADQYAFMSMAAIPSATNLSFPLMKATTVSGRALVNGVSIPGPMPVSFVRNEGGSLNVSTDASGAYTAFLVPGTYTVSLTGANNATAGGVSRFYRFSFAGTATVTLGQTSLSLDLAVTRTLDNTTVSGTATLAGTGESAVVTLTGRGGGAISAQATADSSGSYAVPLAPGTYDVYVTRSFGSAVFLARITVPHAASFAHDLPLSQGFLLSGTVRNPSGAPMSIPVTIQSEAELDTASDASGAFQVLVPAGVYTISASTSATDGANLGSVDVQVDILRVRGLSLGLDTAAPVFDGRFLNYTLLVTNSGNARETVTLAITNPDDLTAFGWSVSLIPSGGSPDGATLSNLTVEATSTVQVGVRAQSTGGPSGASVALTLTAQDSMSVSASKTFTLQLPVLASPGATVSGPDITPSAPLNLPPIAVD